MKFKLVIFGMALCILLAISGCRPDSQSITSGSPEKDPFATVAGSGEEVLFAYGFGLVSPKTDTNMVYDGNDISVEYYVENYGAALSTGMLMFVNGNPQPYSVADGDLTYMHIQEVPAKEKATVEVSFTPVCGYAGETLNVRFVSILNPHIRPDRLEYLWGHTNMITTFFPRKIEMQYDAPNQPAEYPCLAAQRDMTQDEINQVIYVDKKGNQVNKMSVFHLVMRDTQNPGQAYLTVESNCLTFTLQCYGGMSTEYLLIPFVNQVPVLGDNSQCIVRVEAGTKLYEDTYVFDISELDTQAYNIEQFNTFYLLAVPLEGNSQLSPVISNSYVFAGD